MTATNDTRVTVTPRWQGGAMVAERWDPWVELERRRPRVVFTMAELDPSTGGAVWYSDADGVVIIIDAGIEEPRLRTHLLGHELIHDERGGTPADPVLEAREERTVERILAGRLVPLNELDEFIHGMLALDLGVDARAVAEHFEVTEMAARTAMMLLAERREAA